MVAGYSNNGLNSDFAIVRYDQAGNLDNSFDNDGKAFLDLFGGSNEFAVCMRLRSTYIYLAGIIETEGGQDFGIVSVQNDGYPSSLKFLDFAGGLNNNNGLLNWKTTSEENTLEFIIERSIDGQNYSPVGSTSAQNTTGTHQYNFTDHDIVALRSSVIHYRLAIRDVDGNITYSNIIKIHVHQNNGLFAFFPERQS